MNKEKGENQDSYKALQLLDEISKGEPLSQRDLSKKLNIALGLVNSYIKNLVSKGYITIKSIPSKRYAYFLTPKGFTEKTRLTYQLLQDYTNLYKNARRDFQTLFNNLFSTGMRRVVFAGVDEVTEIAYLSLQELDMELAGVIDDKEEGRKFFKTTVKPLKELHTLEFDAIIITTFVKRHDIFQSLKTSGVNPDTVHSIYQISEGSLKAEADSGG
jgi:DNA-binding MarR family transcriptional regulator